MFQAVHAALNRPRLLVLERQLSWLERHVPRVTPGEQLLGELIYSKEQGERLEKRLTHVVQQLDALSLLLPGDATIAPLQERCQGLQARFGRWIAHDRQVMAEERRQAMAREQRNEAWARAEEALQAVLDCPDEAAQRAPLAQAAYAALEQTGRREGADFRRHFSASLEPLLQRWRDGVARCFHQFQQGAFQPDCWETQAWHGLRPLLEALTPYFYGPEWTDNLNQHLTEQCAYLRVLDIEALKSRQADVAAFHAFVRTLPHRGGLAALRQIEGDCEARLWQASCEANNASAAPAPLGAEAQARFDKAQACIVASDNCLAAAQKTIARADAILMAGRQGPPSPFKQLHDQHGNAWRRSLGTVPFPGLGIFGPTQAAETSAPLDVAALLAWTKQLIESSDRTLASSQAQRPRQEAEQPGGDDQRCVP